MTPASPTRHASPVLAIDTSGSDSSVALCTADRVLACAQLDADGRRGEALGTVVAEVLETGKVEVAGLGGLAVVVGPGSYTGLRVGLALVRGLALVDRLPVVPFGTLELLAMSVPAAEPPVRAALLSAGRDKFYAAVYRVDGCDTEPVLQPKVVVRDDLSALLDSTAVDATMCLCLEASSAGSLPAELAARAVHVADVRAPIAGLAAVARLAAGGGIAAEAAVPRYVGGSTARPNRNRVVRNDAVVK